MDWEISGISEDCMTVDELAPSEHAILQGEYRNDVVIMDGVGRHRILHYSTRRNVHMREALKFSSEEAEGLRADLLLQQVMAPASYDDWLLLIDRYPGHVLEVSVYDRFLGDCPRRNSLVWEIRRY